MLDRVEVIRNSYPENTNIVAIQSPNNLYMGLLKVKGYEGNMLKTQPIYETETAAIQRLNEICIDIVNNKFA